MTYRVLLVTPANACDRDIFIQGSRDHCQQHFLFLRSILSSRDVEIGCSDSVAFPDANIVLSLNVLKKIKHYAIEDTVAIIGEPPIIYPPNNITSYRSGYKKILTWEHSKLDNSNHSFLPLCANIQPLNISNFNNNFCNRKDICLISSNKRVSPSPHELYSLRIKAIDYFSSLDEISFSLYGFGWDQRVFYGFLRPFNKVAAARKFLYSPPSSYRGECSSKRDILKNYKFSIIFENYSSTESFITEKIFDCMFSGCIPIYFGSQAITRYVPSSCFIDFRNFSSFSELTLFLQSMNADQFAEYLDSILLFYSKFIVSPFSGIGWALAVANHIFELLDIDQLQFSDLDSFDIPSHTPK